MKRKLKMPINILSNTNVIKDTRSSKDNPEYSVVMPVYLREESHRQTVEDTIKNIRQVSREYELIIVDDASPRDTSFLESFADTYIRNDTNKGISYSWNVGKNSAHAEYVAIVNDDIKVPIGWLDRLKTGFTNEKAGVTAPMFGGPSFSPKTMASNYIGENKIFYPGYCFMLWKDRFFEDFDEQFTTNCGDVDYWHRIYKKGLECIRVGLEIWHKEGGVLHGMDYGKISDESLKLFEDKWGFNPQREYYS